MSRPSLGTMLLAATAILAGSVRSDHGQCVNPVKVGSDVALTNGADWAGEPDVVWNGSEFGVAWSEANDIYFARVDIHGNVLDSRKVNDGDGIQLGHRKDRKNKLPFRVPGPVSGAM